MSFGLTIESAGPGTTIQDGGRFGWLRYGVTSAGPMDWLAFETANLALGNAPDAAAIEIAAGGISLTADKPVSLAFAGGDFLWTLDGRTLPSAARVRILPGEILRARAGPLGAFAYCAVPGGICCPEILGSRATHIRSAIGGLDGRMLRNGDRLPYEPSANDLDDLKIDPPWLLTSNAPVRVVLGPQDDYFTKQAVAAFLDSEFALTDSADRMAYKFEGPTLEHAKDFNIVSDGIALGAIQVPGNGQPIVLMADRQPTGGYPKIACVCRADIGRVAQLRPGASLRFRAIELAEARQALFDLDGQLGALHEHVGPLRLAPTAARLAHANLVSGVSNGERAETGGGGGP